ncbi:gliding motility-associated ABC transporter ATP-binding subunit GldA [Luteibaculum oceani]|uniref:Gliding motility-associated ABC transporter ATP-binding subunit GldA n=1 Tax=Luteibaculum oceani TaxID=1294296 RepID=A0A5C6V2W5_9FLAO|nr:gliding motility-associated ABC transporter ATP-binding subunit GldA [Luteibaculum oceani]TXC78826.1 gliding motility-associated ABC transporter ATP-binding subunit GldA [Luteibaculum oceani]
MSILVENITKEYGIQKALNGVSFEIKTGDVVGFLGPNGAGKSTMMKILTGFIPPTEGKASIVGLDVEEQSLLVREKVGYLPEHNPLYLDMYVKEYLHFVADIFGIKNKKARVEDMIAQVGLTREQKKKIGALSKGYRQRVGLAQALIHDPEVLILDEPTSGLDPNQIIEIRDLIKRVGASKTVMLSTHIMQEVEAICNRVIIINKGNIVADNQVDEIVEEGIDTAVLSVEFSGAIAEKDLLSLEGIVTAKHLKDHQWLLEYKASMDLRKSVFDLAVKKDLAVLGLNKEKRSLEEVFKDVTKD